MDNSVEKLKAACNCAYEMNPDSCSHAVWGVIRGLVNPDEPYRQANELIGYLSENWKEVSLDDAWTLAGTGTVVAGGLSAVPNGHVIVVYPGPKKFPGGYQYYWAKGKKMLTMRGNAEYPLCLSTSIGSWPGAMSKGDKTVWDPWANDEVFKKVTFWSKA